MQNDEQRIVDLENRVEHLERYLEVRFPQTVTAKFGTISRLDDAVIEVPFTLSAAVKDLSTSDFEVTGIENVDMWLVTDTGAEKLILQLPLNVSGILIVDATGSVSVASSGKHAILTSTPVPFMYNTIT